VEFDMRGGLTGLCKGEKKEKNPSRCRGKEENKERPGGQKVDAQLKLKVGILVFPKAGKRPKWPKEKIEKGVQDRLVV